jgi:hypothetical protein
MVKLRKNLQVFLFALSIYAIAPHNVFAQIRDWDDLDGDGTKAGGADTCLINGVPTLECLEVVIGNLLFISNVLILLVLFVMFVIGSVRWMLSLGQPDKVESARNTFKWAIIGLLIYISAYVILFTIDVLFLDGQGKIFQFNIGE